MLVQDHMTSPVITVARDTAIDEALRLLREHEIRQLPVIADKRVIGIVTERDLRRPAKDSHVGDVMTANPVNIGPAASFDEAAKLLREHKFNALPVIDAGELVGIVTTADVLAVFVKLSGVAEPSYRIVIKGPPASMGSAKVRHLIEAKRGEVLWLHHAPGKNRDQIHVRLKARDIEEVTLGLESAGLEVTTVVAASTRKI
jgi:acetoin utilization protein AcuB